MRNIANQTISLLSVSWGITPKKTTRMVQDIIEVGENSVGVFRKDFWRYCQHNTSNQWIELSPLSPLVFHYESEKRK